MRSCTRSAGFVFSTAIVLLCAGARAQAPTAASSALAEALYQQARDLFTAGRLTEACAAFADSQRLEPKLGTLLRLALCHEKAGQIATAWAEYTSAATIAGREGHKEREEFARGRSEALGKQLALVVVKAPAPPPGLVITLDDKPFDQTLLSAPLPIDPGKHRIAAAAPGKREWSSVFEIPPSKAEIPVEIPALEDIAALAPTPPPAATPIPAPTTTPTPAPPIPRAQLAPQPSADPTLAYVGFSVGAAGTLVGAIVGGVAWANAGAVIDACPGGHCPSDQKGPLDTINRLANVSNVGFALGVTGIGAGIVGLVMARRPATPARAAATVTPVITPGGLALQGRF